MSSSALSSALVARPIRGSDHINSKVSDEEHKSATPPKKRKGDTPSSSSSSAPVLASEVSGTFASISHEQSMALKNFLASFPSPIFVEYAILGVDPSQIRISLNDRLDFDGLDLRLARIYPYCSEGTNVSISPVTGGADRMKPLLMDSAQKLLRVFGCPTHDIKHHFAIHRQHSTISIIFSPGLKLALSNETDVFLSLEPLR